MPQSFIRIDTGIAIDRAPARVFDYVTTPALWPAWHPATVAVHGVPERPLTTGETALELISMGGRKDEALWTVRACDSPRSWQIETETQKGAARIAYRIEPRGHGCWFHRTLEFRAKGWLWPLLDSTLTRWILIRQSRRALRNLKQVLEGVA